MRMLGILCRLMIAAAAPLSGVAQAAPDLQATYSYWLEGQKVADLTVGFSVLRVNDAGLETIVVNHTYWTHGLPGMPTGRTEATAIAHHGTDGQVRTLAYTLDFRNVGGGQIAVQRVGTDLKATGTTLPIPALPQELQARAHQAPDPYSAAVLTLFRVPQGKCPHASDVLMPEGLVHLSVTTTSAAKCRILEEPVALQDGSGFIAAESTLEMAQVEDLWLPISGTYIRDDLEMIVLLESISRAGEEIPQLAYAE